MNTIFHNLESTQISTNFPPKDKIAPTDKSLFVTGGDQHFSLNEGMWWLVPNWATEKPKFPTFNARQETVDEKPTFRQAFHSRRCLVPVSGYYEWSTMDGPKQPYLVSLPNDEPMVLAGLWDYNANLDIRSFTIITTAASSNLASLHSRMPIPLTQSVFSQWLDPKTPVDEVREAMEINRANELRYDVTDVFRDDASSKSQMSLF